MWGSVVKPPELWDGSKHILINTHCLRKFTDTVITAVEINTRKACKIT
jgi:hypothetical protein